MDVSIGQGQLDALGVPKKGDCLYASCYCEENIWQLCKTIKGNSETKLAPFRVVFISNSSKRIPLWHQSLGSETDDGFVLWDYHVILLRIADSTCAECLVFDLDTTLPFPCPFRIYFSSAIRFDNEFRSSYQRRFRIISASDYLQRFSSDRSHMRDARGAWIKSPPPWPPIETSEHKNCIEKFWSMNNEDDNFLNDVSEILDTKQMYQKYVEFAAI